MLKGSNISFCDKQTFNIIDDNLKKNILDILKNDYFIGIKDRNFYIINKKNINYIEKHPFILSVKSIGSPYYLFLTKVDNKKYCFYIDRKVKEGHNYPRILSVLYRFNDELFNNTLFDGELLRDNDNNWMFIINSLLIHKGEIMKNKNIIYKLNLVYDILTNKYIKDENLEICPLYVKRLFSYHQWDELKNDYLTGLNYKYKGICFENPKFNKNYLYIFNKKYNNTSKNNNLKIKNNVKSPICKSKIVNKKLMNFVLNKTDISDIYDLYCYKEDTLFKYDVASVNTLKVSKKLNKLFKDTDRLVFECSYNTNDNKWTPLNKIETDDIDNIESINNYIKSL